MSLIQCLIVIVPLCLVSGMALYSRRFIRGVADFLVAGRVAGRYVLSVAGMIDGLSVFTLVAMCEANYQTGFAMSYWNNILLPLGIFLGLTGYLNYRFRETCAMSMGQFLEMRYSRSLRIFATCVRCFAEMLTNCIGPAVAARFFIYLLGLPMEFQLFGHTVSTFVMLLILCLSLAVGVILAGGRLALIITDCFQGLMSYPIFVIIAVFVFTNFSWFHEIAPVMGDRIAGESFLNPYDIYNLRDFNMFALFVLVFGRFFDGVWLGNDTSGAARTPHEQKMAGILGRWRAGYSTTMSLLLVISVITLLNHAKFSSEAHQIRTELVNRVAEEIVPSQETRVELARRIGELPPPIHRIGEEEPLSRRRNLDTAYLTTVSEVLHASPGVSEENGNQQFQNFRSMYNQMMLPVTLKTMLPPTLLALFLLLGILLMLSTDDSLMFNSASALIQDLVVPLCKKPLPPETHVKLLKLMTIVVTLVFFWGSIYLSQLDFLNLFITITISIWGAGAGGVVTFGLYSRRGTTAGAYASILVGGLVSGGGILVQRNWADTVYPTLSGWGMIPMLDHALTVVSSPLNPWVVWEMNPLKFPINSMEISFLAMLLAIAAYWLVSLLTFRQPFNLDRMLHRGIYNLNPEKMDVKPRFSWHGVFQFLVSITPDYTFGDKVITWFVFGYFLIYKFLIMFVAVVVVNLFYPLPDQWWSIYFLINSLIDPCIVGIITTVWFMIGGIKDLRRLFCDLAVRRRNPLDNGMVANNVSLSDIAEFESLEQKKQS
ncbi:sodium:panthothenate symporter [Victivallaceae bacterium BBE-744-WT-12]|uniref:Sodium:panthothenate symporter n=1 Tax=Victivallis lenta TaxID=2606640 RepID=A0A844G527_9BACT|nr:sodium:panthothenate symporter [Victivallis lenta]MST97711.1 sodium:panthothenate symporter [Victivallis lenta]